MGDDQRRYARASVELDVKVEATGNQWAAKTVNLSPYGVKVASQGKLITLPRGARAQVVLTLGEQEAPLSLPANVVRADLDGVALNFENLEEQQFQRLKRFVDARLQQEWEALMNDTAIGQPRDTGVGREERKPKEPSETGGAGGSENDDWQALLKRLGLETLQLPTDGTLSGQWKEFLKQLEIKELKKQKGRKDR